MMALFFATLRDKRWAVMGWSIGVIAMSWLTILFFPSISGTSGLEELTKNVPPQLQGLVGDALAFRQLDHYIGEQVLNLRVPLLLLIFAVMLAIGLTVTEEERRTLKTLQTFPISRGKVVLAKWLAMITALFVVAVAAGIGIFSAVGLIHDSISVSNLVGAIFLLWLLAAGTASLTFCLGLATGKKGLTTLLSSVFVATNIILPGLALSIKDLETASKFTPYYYYNTPTVFVESINWEHALVLGLVSVVSLLVAFVCYKRRDIAA